MLDQAAVQVILTVACDTSVPCDTSVVTSLVTNPSQCGPWIQQVQGVPFAPGIPFSQEVKGAPHSPSPLLLPVFSSLPLSHSIPTRKAFLPEYVCFLVLTQKVSDLVCSISENFLHFAKS